jgi:predicted TIM-barrel fold metal-dependent hydrolase
VREIWIVKAPGVVDRGRHAAVGALAPRRLVAMASIDMQEVDRAVGKRAAERAIKRLNPRKVKTQGVPVFFEDKNHSCWRPKVGDALATNNT